MVCPNVRFIGRLAEAIFLSTPPARAFEAFLMKLLENQFVNLRFETRKRATLFASARACLSLNCTDFFPSNLVKFYGKFPDKSNYSPQRRRDFKKN
jgi:hypothetical protein